MLGLHAFFQGLNNNEDSEEVHTPPASVPANPRLHTSYRPASPPLLALGQLPPRQLNMNVPPPNSVTEDSDNESQDSPRPNGLYFAASFSIQRLHLQISTGLNKSKDSNATTPSPNENWGRRRSF